MSFESDLKDHLEADLSVANIIRDEDKTPRIFFLRLPALDDAFLAEFGDPVSFLRLYSISSTSHDALDGDTGVVTERYQIDNYAISPSTMIAIDLAVKKSLRPLRGMMGNTLVKSCLVRGKKDLYEDPIDGSDRGMNRRLREYIFVYDEAA